MRTHLGTYFWQLRENRGLRPGQLALLIGYKDPSKGGFKVSRFEQGDEAFPELVQKLMDFFQVDPQVVIELIEKDHRDYIDRVNAFLDEPIEPYVSIRVMPAVYSTKKLPPEIKTLEEGKDFARKVLEKWPLKCVLIWTRRISVYFDPENKEGCQLDSTPERMYLIYSQVGNRPFLWGSDFRSVIGVKLPPNPRPKGLSGWKPALRANVAKDSSETEADQDRRGPTGHER